MENKTYRVDVQLTVKISCLVDDTDSFSASKGGVKWIIDNTTPSSFSLDETNDTVELADIKVIGCNYLHIADEPKPVFSEDESLD